MNYFVFQRKDLPSVYFIYTAITMTDISICSSVIPVIISLVCNRDPMVFGNDAFCTLWGGFWRVLQTFSVFLVAVLSITRTLSLLNVPLNNSKVLVIIFSYAGFLLVRHIMLVAVGEEYYVYAEENSVYCWPTSDNQRIEEAISFSLSIQLALPILPIVISCKISTYILLSSAQIQTSSGKDKKREATITIVIVTFVYIVLNIPVFANEVVFLIHSLGHDAYPGRYYSSTIMYYYSWTTTTVVSVALNSAINPIIYFCRMKRFRVYTEESIVSKVVSDMYSHVKELYPTRVSAECHDVITNDSGK